MNDTKLTRRQFGRLLTAAPLLTAAAVDRAPAAARPPFSLRYILGSCMYGTLKLEEILPEVHKVGSRHIDVWPLKHGDQREQIEAMGHDRFGELLAEHDVRLGISTRYDLGPFGLGEEMPFIKKFGGRMIVTGSRGPKNVAGAEARQAVRQFVEEMKPHTAVAEELGLVIGIENHANALVATLDSLRYFAEFAASPSLGIALAPYHLPQDPGVLARLIDDLGPKLVHFYAWQHGQGCMEPLPKEQELEQLPGRGSLDFTPLLAALGKIGYQGWTEIFMHPVPRGIPIMPTLTEVTREINLARRHLEACLAGL